MHEKLKAGFKCNYLNSRPMVAGLQSYLAALGIDVTDELAIGSLVLSSETVVDADGEFDVDLMFYKLEHTVDQELLEGYKACGPLGI